MTDERATRRRLWLVAPAWAACAADVAFTLVGQPGDYWAGDFARADEANPVAHPFLTLHPLAFVAGAGAWAAAFGLLVLCGSPRMASVVAVLFTFSHAIGGAGWLARHGGVGWLLAAGYLAAVARLAAWCWRKGM